MLPAHLQHVFLANSGAGAVVDGAIKFARLTTGRTGWVATMRGFHGRTIWRCLGDVGTQIPQAL